MIDSVYPVNIVGNLKGSNFSPQRWDKIHYTLQQYQMLAKNDSLYEKEIRRIYQNMHLPFAKKDNYISITVANDWYQQLILKTLSTKEVYQKIHSSVYRWDGEGLDTEPINLRN